MGKTKINWADYVINPIQDSIKGESGRGYHCTKYSPGCLNCYAETINNRFGNHLPFDGRKAEFQLVESELKKLAKWKKPRNIFVQSMGDLFHDLVRDRDIDAIWSTISKSPQHTFLILTKRPERMADFVSEVGVFNYDILPNLYLGLTICTQQEADEKMPIFLKIPGKKFLSIEPMLGEIDFRGLLWRYGTGVERIRLIHAVILGGETGPKARPMSPDWVRSIRDQCQAAGVPFFFKSWGEWLPGSQHFYEFKQMRGSTYETEPIRVGKKKSGRGLDGRTHDALPWL